MSHFHDSSKFKSDSKEIYQFSNKEEEKLFTKIISELRCTVCQNQPLSESEMPLAMDLKHEIYRQVHLAQPEQKIVEFVVEQYGDFILYRPPFNGYTLMLWLGPLLMLCIGLFIVYRQFKILKK